MSHSRISQRPPLPPDIVVQDQWPDSLRFALPRRQLGHGKWFALLLVAVGMATMTAVVLCIANFAIGWPPFRNPCTLMAALLLAPMTWGGLAPFWWGISMLLGHRELELRDGKIRTTERVGPFWRSKRWSIGTLSSLEVKPLSSQGGVPPPNDILAPFTALVLHTQAGKQGMLAWGYRIELLAPLATELAAQCKRALELNAADETHSNRQPLLVLLPQDRVSDDASEQPDETAEDDDNAVPGDVPMHSLPDRSTIEIERFDNHNLTIRVPPLGVLKGSGGLFAFGLVWCGFMFFIDGIALFAMFRDNQRFEDLAALIGFSALFWLVGIGLLLTAIHWGRREAALALAGGQLMVIQKGLFGTKRREWPIEEVARICTGPSGIEVNNRPLLELQIHGRDNTKFGMLTGRTDEELHWLAQELSHAWRSASSSADSP